MSSAQVVAQGADDRLAFLVDQERRRAAFGGLCDRLPDVQQVVEVPLQFFGVRPTPAVRTMTPMSSGICRLSSASRSCSRSSPSMRRETPPARGLFGISTR